MQKLLSFFQQNIGLFQILTFEILTKRYLTISLDLNHQAQKIKFIAYIFTFVFIKILLKHLI